MNNLSLIVAIGKNNEIGKDNKLLWNIPEDLNFFKERTINKTIVMGSNTFYSLPRILPNRHYIVLTKSNDKFPNEIEVFNDFEKLLNDLSNRNEEIFIIGGSAIYKLFINYVDKMYITEIDKEYEADKFFPKVDYDKWDKEILCEHSYNDLNYKHVLYKRKRV